MKMKNNSGMSGIVIMLGLVLTTSLFYAFITLVTKLYQDYEMTKNRGESYLCFHFGKNEMIKYIDRIETANTAIVAAKTASAISIKAAVASDKLVKGIKAMQEGFKIYFVYKIWRYPYCDNLQTAEIIVQGLTIYKNQLGTFRRYPIIDTTMLSSDIAKNKKVEIELHNLRKVKGRSILNSNTFVLKGEIGLDRSNFTNSKNLLLANETPLHSVLTDSLKNLAISYLEDMADQTPEIRSSLRKLTGIMDAVTKVFP